MRTNIWLLSLITLALLFCTQNLVAQNVYLPHYTTKNGLPSNNCFYIHEDKKGFIWVATTAGISRFDGAVFENFSVDDGLPDNQILQIREDSKGRIWFIALNGKMSYFKNGKIYNAANDSSLKNLMINGVVVSFLEDSTGKLWFGTNNNLICSWNGRQTTAYTTTAANDRLQNAYLFEEDGKIKAINNTGLFQLEKNTFSRANTSSTPFSFKTVFNSNNKLSFVNANGLFTRNSTITLQQKLTLTNTNLGYIAINDKGLWLCSNNGVLNINQNGHQKTFLKGSKVNQVVSDSKENMWFTTDEGIYKLPKQEDQLYQFINTNSVSGTTFKSIAKDNQNRLWLGSTNGSITILDLNTFTASQLNLPNKNALNTIKQLQFDPHKNRMFFSSDNALGYVDASHPLKNEPKFLREINNNVFVIKNFSLSTDGKIAIALSSGVLILDNTDDLTFSSYQYKQNINFFKDRSYRVFYDNTERLWFSNINGLSSIVSPKLVSYTKSTSMFSKRINDIAQLGNGSMALATDGYGVIIFNKKGVKKIVNKQTGLTNNVITKMFVNQNQLWTLSISGINQITSNKDEIKVNTIDDVNGMLSDDLNDLLIDNDTAYFATNNGLLYFAHKNLETQNTSKVYITSITNNGNVLDVSKPFYILKPKNQSLSINYSYISYNNKNITYKYRLNPNRSWIETKNRRLELSSLAPGNYQVEIAAKTQNTSWSAPAKLNFTIEKRLTQKWWFMAICGTLLALIIFYIAVKLTKRQKDKEQEKLLLRNKILTLEQQALQAMMNPHFVFNAMNSIQHYINTKDTTQANKVLTGFARLVRKNLEICTKSYISLAEELNYLTLYLSLEKNRFGDKLTYTIDIDPDIDTEEIEIPSMLLQPFLENAIWHGIMPEEDGGHITLSVAETTPTTITIIIADDGVGISNSLAQKDSNHQSKGMKLTKERIDLLNEIESKSIQLSVQQNGIKGTLVVLSISI